MSRKKKWKKASPRPSEAAGSASKSNGYPKQVDAVCGACGKIEPLCPGSYDEHVAAIQELLEDEGWDAWMDFRIKNTCIVRPFLLVCPSCRDKSKDNPDKVRDLVHAKRRREYADQQKRLLDVPGEGEEGARR